MIAESDSVAESFVNTYAQTKYYGEQRCLDPLFADLEPVIIRPRGILGEGDTSIMPRILKVAKKGRFPVFNNGDAMVDATYVGNVVEALSLTAKTEGIGGECFNISNNEPMTVKALTTIAFDALKQNVEYKKVPYELIDRLAGVLELWSKAISKKEPLITCYSAGLLAFSQTLDITKAQQVLGYMPVLSLEEGVQRYAQWYQS